MKTMYKSKLAKLEARRKQIFLSAQHATSEQFYRDQMALYHRLTQEIEAEKTKVRGAR